MTVSKVRETVKSCSWRETSLGGRWAADPPTLARQVKTEHLHENLKKFPNFTSRVEVVVNLIASTQRKSMRDFETEMRTRAA